MTPQNALDALELLFTLQNLGYEERRVCYDTIRTALKQSSAEGEACKKCGGIRSINGQCAEPCAVGRPEAEVVTVEELADFIRQYADGSENRFMGSLAIATAISKKFGGLKIIRSEK